MIQVDVLDAVAVRRDGTRTPLGTGKVAELLVRLALEPGVTLRTDRLIDDLWAGEGRATARNTLQATVSRLRRVLGCADLVTGSRAGYTLEVEAGAVDVSVATELADRAVAHRRAGDPSAALAASVAGLALFGGEVLPGGGDGEWVAPHRHRLGEVRLALIEGKLSAQLHLGASGEVTGELEALVLEHPLREGLWASLMLALYRDGRQADALAAYARVRRLLADELGLDPGQALQALEQQVLLQDPTLRLQAGPGSQRPRTNAPTLTWDMVGREDDLAAVALLVVDHRLVTLVGTAGVGKTRLATEVARGADRPGGAWLVRLDSARDAASVLHAVCEVLDVAGGTEALLLDHLRGAHVLLVLDGCEHVVGTVAELVARVLDATPWVDVLCTSQLPLGMDGEAVYHLEPLALEDSARLFTRLAVRHRASVVRDGGAARVIDGLCLSLDGLPLAIELAAARTRTLSVEEISRRLDDRFALLADPTSRLPARRRALGAAIGWSYDLLFPDDQRGLWALACFSGGATLAALEEVLGALDVPRTAAIDILSRLADRSLIAVDEHPGADRYRLLDSIRDFATERMGEAGCADVAQRAHAEWFGHAAAAAADGVRGPDQAGHLAVTRGERANIDAALVWCRSHDPALGLRIAGGFAWAWFVLGDRPLGAARVGRALEAAHGEAAVTDLERATALCHAAWLATGDVGQAHADAEAAIQIATASQDERVRALGGAALAFVLLQQARPHDALQVLEGCPAVQQRLGRPWDEAAAWILTVHAALTAGDPAQAARACEGARAVVPALGDDWASGHLHAAEGYLAQTERRFLDAAGHLRGAAEASERLGFRATQSLHLASLGRILQQAGDPGGAVAALERAIALGFAVKDMRVVSLARVRLARVLREEGDHEGARAAARAADDWFRSAGGGEGAALAACLRAALDAEDGDPAAKARLAAVLNDAETRNDPEIEILALDALARACARDGDLAAAHAALDAADRLMPAAQHLIGDADRADAIQARRLLAV